MNRPRDRSRSYAVSPVEPHIEGQEFLGPAPEGIDVRYAWQFDGGRGEGLGFVDLELGWTLDHEDLVSDKRPVPQVLCGQIVDGEREHGTSALGVVASTSERPGHIGIAPNVESLNVVSYWPDWDIADTILIAVKHLEFGDVLLLEAHVREVGHPPVEVFPNVFDAIRQATAKGITVVEPAGNGGIDLDEYRKEGRRTPSRTAESDSMAILVAAATADAPHAPIQKNMPDREWGTNFGSRVDCYAWGERVATCTSNSLASRKAYTDSFHGTSSAAAIVAGAALVIQGIAEHRLGRRFGPLEIRSLLSDPSLATPSMNGLEIDRIGVMPDLRGIVAHEGVKT